MIFEVLDQKWKSINEIIFAFEVTHGGLEPNLNGIEWTLVGFFGRSNECDIENKNHYLKKIFIEPF